MLYPRPILRSCFPAAYLAVADRDYHFPTRQEVIDFLVGTWFEYYRWLREKFDCDDFSYLLAAFVRQEAYRLGWPKPWAFGEVFAEWPGWGKHARNLVILNDGKVQLVEPQTDALVGTGIVPSAEWVRI